MDLKFGIGIAGLIITVIGWFFDHIKSFDRAMMILFPKYHRLSSGLRDLQAGQMVLPHDHTAFEPFIARWASESVAAPRFIGRSVAYVQFGATASNDFDIFLFDQPAKNPTILLETLGAGRIGSF